MKIYTKAGDHGCTALFGGEQVSKSSEFLQAYGALDELGAVMGMLTSHMTACSELFDLIVPLQSIQKCLFILSSSLATPPDKRTKLKIGPLTGENVKQLEDWIDHMESELVPLKSFILPGGHITATVAQLARTVARRAEREMIHCYELRPIWKVPFSIEYINRLSDYFFVLSRYFNLKMQQEEISWP